MSKKTLTSLKKWFSYRYKYVILLILLLLTNLSAFFYFSTISGRLSEPWPRYISALVAPSSIEIQNKTGKLLVWPEDDPGDRILAQLQITIPSDVPMKTIYFSRADFFPQYGYEYFVSNNCSAKCIFTPNRTDADAVLFRHIVMEERKEVSQNQIWILFSLESPFHQGIVSYEGSINWTATYRRDSDVVAPYAKWVYFDEKVRVKPNVTKNYALGKTKKVAWFVSNCQARNNRLGFAQELSKYIEVDIYGHCGYKKCDRSEKECFEMLRKDYKFYLAFENSNCRDYITEKFYVNALQNDILPIVMGAHPEDYKIGPEHSYIHVDEFSSAEELASYLHMLDVNDDLYNYYFRWKGTGKFINPKFFCRLCAMLYVPRPPKHYDNFKDWWNGKNVCLK